MAAGRERERETERERERASWRKEEQQSHCFNNQAAPTAAKEKVGKPPPLQEAVGDPLALWGSNVCYYVGKVVGLRGHKYISPDMRSIHHLRSEGPEPLRFFRPM